jgi:hypothetical protein
MPTYARGRKNEPGAATPPLVAGRGASDLPAACRVAFDRITKSLLPPGDGKLRSLRLVSRTSPLKPVRIRGLAEVPTHRYFKLVSHAVIFC